MAHLILKELRKERRITQKELGTAIGVSTSTIGMYEQGRRIPPLDIVVKLSDFFSLPIDALVSRDD